MKKKKKIFCCLLFLIYMLLGSGAFFGIKGYEMYREAITDEPIDQRIEKIRSQENYVDYDSLPQFYVKAVSYTHLDVYKRQGLYTLPGE